MVQSINKINRIQGIRFLASALQKWSKCLLAKRYSERMTEFDRNCHLSAANKIQPRLLPFSKIEIGALFYLETEGNDIDATQQYIRHMISTEIKQTIQLYKKKLLASHYVFSHKDTIWLPIIFYTRWAWLKFVNRNTDSRNSNSKRWYLHKFKAVIVPSLQKIYLHVTTAAMHAYDTLHPKFYLK
jgi:hypothetical protein